MNNEQEIPEWIGNRLTNGAFHDYAAAVRDAYVGVGLEDINLTALGMKLVEAVDALHLAIKRQAAFDETADVTRADTERDACFKALWHAWDYLGALGETHPFAAHVKTLTSEMNAYKGVWKHELTKETSELLGFKAALSTEANRAALAALGLDKIADALFAANDAAHDAMTARRDERGERDTEKAAGTTPELRKTVAGLLVAAGKRVNAVHDLDPDNEKAALAISKVCGIINDFKRVASEAKRRKGDEPAPAPTPEPAGGASAL